MGRNWTEQEDNLLRKYIAQFGRQWSVIATYIPGRNATQVAARWEKCINPKLTKGPFSPDEDQLIINFVETHGIHAWPKVTSVLPNRTAKQCRERWFNNLDPTVTKEPWTPEEDNMIFELYQEYGPKWSQIARLIPGRTDNSIKNRWHASISKRMTRGDDGLMMLTPAKSRKHSRTPIRPPSLKMAEPPTSADSSLASSPAEPPAIQISPLPLVSLRSIPDLSMFNIATEMEDNDFFANSIAMCSPIPTGSLFSPFGTSTPFM